MTLVRDVHFLNACVPILVTPFPIVTLVRPEFLNALEPILVTESGIVMLVRAGHEVQPLESLAAKALSTILVAPSSMVT